MKQLGLITRRQAHGYGMSAKAIDYRLRSGLWGHVHPGVYLIGPGGPHRERDLLAACFWSRGYASHRSAAGLFDLAGSYPRPIEVTVSRCRFQPRCGIIVHYTNRLPPPQTSKVKGIPCTSIERTLLDLGAVTGERTVAVALDDALRRELTDLERLDGCLALTARRGRRGVRTLRRLIHQRLGLPETAHTPLETLIFQLLNRSFVLAEPELQYEIHDDNGNFVARPDFVYPREMVIVEGHSYRWHSGQYAWEHDFERHNRLSELGWLTIYVTWNDATKAADSTLARIEQTVLARRRLLPSTFS